MGCYVLSTNTGESVSQAFFTFCKIVNMYKYSKIITKNVSWKENLCYVVVLGL